LDIPIESQSTQQNQSTELDNTISLVNEDDNDVAASVMTEDVIPLTQTVDVAKSIATPNQRQPTENVALPSCSPAYPGIDLY
jgi:succinate dehydrogenase flavin-adding protein (antitoxin of CptAB toxin-antitoxin module)